MRIMGTVSKYRHSTKERTQVFLQYAGPAETKVELFVRLAARASFIAVDYNDESVEVRVTELED